MQDNEPSKPVELGPDTVVGKQRFVNPGDEDEYFIHDVLFKDLLPQYQQALLKGGLDRDERWEKLNAMVRSYARANKGSVVEGAFERVLDEMTALEKEPHP